MNTAVFVLNRTGNSSVLNESPFKVWFGKTPSINSLHVFGSNAYVHVPKEKRRKWDSKSIDGVFVGYSENTKGYRIWYKNVGKVVVACDVMFEKPSAGSISENCLTPSRIMTIFQRFGIQIMMRIIAIVRRLIVVAIVGVRLLVVKRNHQIPVNEIEVSRLIVIATVGVRRQMVGACRLIMTTTMCLNQIGFLQIDQQCHVRTTSRKIQQLF